MTEIKVGDKVKIIDTLYLGLKDIGKIGEVVVDFGHAKRVRVGEYEGTGNGDTGEGFCYSYFPHHLELIEADEEESKFEVTKQVRTEVKGETLTVFHMSNSKKGKVSTIGTLTENNLSEYIELLGKLKEEI